MPFCADAPQMRRRGFSVRNSHYAPSLRYSFRSPHIFLWPRRGNLPTIRPSLITRCVHMTSRSGISVSHHPSHCVRQRVHDPVDSNFAPTRARVGSWVSTCGSRTAISTAPPFAGCSPKGSPLLMTHAGTPRARYSPHMRFTVMASTPRFDPPQVGRVMSQSVLHDQAKLLASSVK